MTSLTVAAEPSAASAWASAVFPAALGRFPPQPGAAQGAEG